MRKVHLLPVVGLSILATVLTGLFLIVRPAFAVTSVGSETDLRAALAAGETDIAISSDFTITSSVVLPARAVSFNLGGHILSLGSGVEDMFSGGAGANATFSNGTLDGARNGRLFILSQATLNLNEVTVKNGSTQSFQKKINATTGVNEQSYLGGAIHTSHSTVRITDSIFQGNTTKTDAPAQEVDAQGQSLSPAINTHGGAIYSATSNIFITGGSFLDNVSGRTVHSDGSTQLYGEGGAIKMEGGSQLSINMDSTDTTKRTVFDGNHNYVTGSSQSGLQGGAIEATGDGTRAQITRTDFVVKGGFDTGGAIKFEGAGSAAAPNTITDSTFTLVGGQLPTSPVASTYFGTSGGSIMSENSYLTIERSNFTMENRGAYPTLTFAGGHIDVVGSGELKLYDSTLSGNGAAWNSPHLSSAKYGGALAFENGASARAHIRGTSFTNFTTDHVGGVIAVGHRTDVLAGSPVGNTTVDLLMENSTIDNARAYTWNGLSGGAGMYIADGANVVISSGSIRNTQANYAGAIFNRGNLTLINKVSLSNNSSTQMVGGIYNDGYLNVHSANFTNNQKTDDGYFNGGNHAFSSGEHSGGTIYAKKDVIIGTDATFSTRDKQDVRVIEGQSSVIYSGPRTSQVNVSLSETESNAGNGFFGPFFRENAHRHLGYLIARGLTPADLTAPFTPDGLANTYEIVPTDAQSTHYVSRSVDANKIAAYADHTSPAVWDYVYDPEAKTVVLGQRAMMKWHSNHAQATIANQSSVLPDADKGLSADADTSAGPVINQLYTMYAPAKVSIADRPATELTLVDIKPSLSVTNTDGSVETYSLLGWYLPELEGHPLADLQAGTPRENQKYNFTERTFTNLWASSGEITDILNFGDKNTLHTYAVYRPGAMTVKVTKVWNVTDAANKQDVTFVLGGGPDVDPLTNEQIVREITLSANDTNSTVQFENLPKFDTSGNRVAYTVSEKGAQNGLVTLNGSTFTAEVVNDTASRAEADREPNTEYFTATNTLMRQLTLTKAWGGDYTTKPEVSVQLYKKVADGQETPVGAPVKLNAANNWSSTTAFVPAVEKVGNAIQPIVYSVKEIGENAGTITLADRTYTVTYSTSGEQQNTLMVTNTLNNQETSISGTKVWDDTDNIDGVRPDSVTVELLANGQPTGQVTQATEASQWNFAFTGLQTFDAKGDTITYSVKEHAVAQYASTITRNNDGTFTITNSHTPAPVTVKVTKVWNVTDAANKQDVTFVLSGGESLDPSTNERIVREATLNASDASGTVQFENLPKFDTSGNRITYTVSEKGAQNGLITLNGTMFTVDIVNDTASRAEANREPNTEYFTATNTQWRQLTITKAWGGNYTTKPEVFVHLLKKVGDEQETPVDAPVKLNADNQWSVTQQVPAFERVGTEMLPVTYSVKEIGENAGTITLADRTYTVTYSTSGEQQNTLMVTNTLNNQETSISGTKVWDDANNQDGIRPNAVTVELLANGQPTGQVTQATEASQWNFAFTGLQTFDAKGDTITYSVKEHAVTQYASTITRNDDGTFTITNTYTPGVRHISVTKVWEDNDNMHGLRPEQVQFTLLANGQPTEHVMILDNNGENTWSGRFENLPINQDGNPIDYTITEENVPSYTSSQSGTADTGFTVVNSINQGSITLTKVSDKGEVLRGATFELRGSDGTAIAQATSDVDGLVRFENLLLGEYTIVETQAPEGYVKNEDILTATIRDANQHIDLGRFVNQTVEVPVPPTPEPEQPQQPQQPEPSQPETPGKKEQTGKKNLAKTGADTVPLLAGAFSMLTAGAFMATRGRRTHRRVGAQHRA